MNQTGMRIEWRTLLITSTLLIAILPALAVGRQPDRAIAEGQELFNRRFELGHSLSPDGDGLGPMFNHVSCAACHVQGGIGGGGPVDVNVDILSAQLANPGSRPTQKSLVATLKSLHPAFLAPDEKIIPSIILHRFGLGSRYAEARRLFAPDVPLEPSSDQRVELQRSLAEQPQPVSKKKQPITLIRTQRNTTALFGAGKIDEIPDDILRSIAAAQAREGQVSGRVPPVGPDKVGRFGWRGQIEHLHDFVLGACANELGLEVPGNPQPMDPVRPKYRPAGLDLTAEKCRSLTAFVAALPAPKFVEPKTDERRDLVAQGRKAFSSLGCAACHLERIGPVESIFSDLLLHDMGPALADPVLAAATLELVKQRPLAAENGEAKLVNSSIPRITPPQPSPSGSYYGGPSFTSLAISVPPSTVRLINAQAGMENEYRVQQTNLDREWRTPPLWGLADSAPYLHDGRAATVVEAIALHGGEADASTKKFFAASAADRLAVLEFLKCLRAPQLALE
jgi:CxxC motif-containing protein (DUF1111 family)